MKGKESFSPALFKSKVFLMSKLGDFLSGQVGSVLDDIVNKVNTATKQVDLSGIKTPTIKTDNKFGGPVVWVLGGLALLWFLFKK